MADDTTVDVEWNGKELLVQANRQIHKNAHKAARMLDSRVSNAVKRGQKKRRMPNGKFKGLEPSRPGEPPRLLSGQLKRSINHRVSSGRRGSVRIWVGANTSYARALEKGNPSRGLQPRPYLKSTLEKHRETLIRVLMRGVFRQARVSGLRRGLQ